MKLLIKSLPELKSAIEKAEKWDDIMANKHYILISTPALRVAIEKAEKYDKLFEKLQVAMKCGCTETITSAKVFCKLCNGTGKISRELTEMEKEEIFEYIVERERRIIIGSYLDSSDFKMQNVEVKK